MFLQPEKSLLELQPQAYFRLIVHGGVEDVTSLKISAESHMEVVLDLWHSVHTGMWELLPPSPEGSQ